SRSPGQNAGTYTILQNTLQAGNNYTLSYVSADLVINKAVLNVKADNKTRCYGDNNPTWTISYSGFKNGDTVSSLADLPTVSTNAQPDSPAGSYSLLVEGGSSANYLFIYEEGMMIIEEVPVVY